MTIAYIQKNLYIGSAEMVKRPATTYDLGIRSVLRLDVVDGMDWIEDFSVHHLPIANEFELSDEQILEATTAIQRMMDEKPAVLIQCRDGSNLSVVIAMAYLMQYTDLSLANAFVRVITRSHSALPAPNLVRKLVDYYGLPYSTTDAGQLHFLEKLIAEAQAAINPIYNGVHLSGAASINKMDKVRSMGIGSVLRLDRVNRASGQWADDFIMLDMPVRDAAPIPPEQLDAGTAFIHEQVEQGNKVLVHCQMGVSRAPTFVMAYLMKYAGMSLGDAYRLISQERPIINPSHLLVQSLMAYFGLPEDDRVLYRADFLDNYE